MTVRKSGSRFFPVKKNGTLWKTGFSSKAKAEAAIRQNKARLSKLTGRGGGGGGKKKSTTAGNPSPASKSSKALTHHGFMKALALGGSVGSRVLAFQAGGDQRELSVGIPFDYTGVDIEDGSFKLDRMGRTYGGALYLKIEDFILKGAGVAPPSLKRKGIKAKAGLGVYHAAAVANTMGGTSTRDKFHRFYHSHYGVNLNLSGFDALDYSKPIIEKVVPYIIFQKAMKFFKV